MKKAGNNADNPNSPNAVKPTRVSDSRVFDAGMDVNFAAIKIPSATGIIRAVIKLTQVFFVFEEMIIAMMDAMSSIIGRAEWLLISSVGVNDAAIIKRAAIVEVMTHRARLKAALGGEESMLFMIVVFMIIPLFKS